ncbi:hypothetical protein TTRE_0000122401 [Trichuris trichiura]|uniref:ZP domain-containing protein n=1 Tax=Trichuris trichiura TaxID=36087 RepID=A0A077YXW9_TRITR|nr:hypothetical protein TTRE_0000122401 [Trichuris trichiura]
MNEKNLILDVHFNVVECEAYSGKNYSLVLIGINAEHGLLSQFRYEGNVAIAEFPSMFRFVHNKLIHFQCVVEYQDEPQINFDIFAAASGNRSISIAANMNKSRLQALTSTMVMVAPPDYETGMYMYPDCDTANFIQLLLCVILATVFAIETTIYWYLKIRNDKDKSVHVKTYPRNGDELKQPCRRRNFVVSPDNLTENHDSGCDCCSLYEVPSRLHG